MIHLKAGGYTWKLSYSVSYFRKGNLWWENFFWMRKIYFVTKSCFLVLISLWVSLPARILIGCGFWLNPTFLRSWMDSARFVTTLILLKSQLWAGVRDGDLRRGLRVPADGVARLIPLFGGGEIASLVNEQPPLR